MPFLPLRHEVELFPVIDSGRDNRGNLKRAYDAPVKQRIYGMGPLMSSHSAIGGPAMETVGPNRLVIDCQMFVPPGFVCKPFDRIRFAGRLFDVVGYLQDYGSGPFEFNPGAVVNLRWVEG
ncbi:hypothetical protein [Nocardia terpenica]|uniref:Uncharacterized protein n=1 Tax=Nocardia terpenica TaxID=455432 RepID=A0A6G9Z788_9NOCA|nr:hypothetical protein [Nocardia terpenica]QIS21261.1 hypothetical protein F6W96_25970 [Nocardia terpenica]